MIGFSEYMIGIDNMMENEGERNKINKISITILFISTIASLFLLISSCYDSLKTLNCSSFLNESQDLELRPAPYPIWCTFTFWVQG